MQRRNLALHGGVAVMDRSNMPQPLVVAYGMGVDSTAVLVEFAGRRHRPGLILFADTGAEKEETYAYMPIMNAFLERHGFPTITVVRHLVAARNMNARGSCV